MKEVARAIIRNEEGQFLLGRRTNKGIGKNKLALFGGKPDGNETLEEAVCRELLEEVGVVFEPKLFLEHIDSESEPGVEWRVGYFSGNFWGDPKILTPENVEIGWFDLDEIKTREDVAFEHKEVLVIFSQQNP